jgi:hypothetical protein
MATVSNPDPRNWAISTRSQSRDLYALALLDKKFAVPDSATTRTLAQAAIPSFEYVFNVNPKTIDLEEPAAVTITPTQDGGQFVEHQGSIYKTINISGTTGVRPNQAGPSLIPVIGIPGPSFKLTNPMTLLPRGETSGFQDLINLRNLFRAYFDCKASPDDASDIVMVWQNGKEGEYYVVEPISFKTRRDASSPLAFIYEIQLRTISKLAFRTEHKQDPMTIRSATQHFNSRISQAIRELTVSVNTIKAIPSRLVGIGQAVVNSVLTPASQLLNALTGLITGSNDFPIPRSSLVLLAHDSMAFYESLSAFTTQIDNYLEHGTTNQVIVARESCKRVARTATRLAAEDQLFSPSASQQFKARSSAYRANGQPPLTGGSPTDLQNAAASSGTSLTTVLGNDTIFTAAHRLLGDSARWKELVILNDLRYPYIDPTGNGNHVLRPGDQMLVPANSSIPVSGVSASKKLEDRLTTRLGRDIRLRADQIAGAIATYDVDHDQRGDLARIEGVPNMAQAINIKFETEQGTLPTHPEFGLKYPIGSKALIRSLVGYQLNARSSLLADSRISTVDSLSFQTEGNAVTVSSELSIADVDQTVSVSFDVRR